MISSIRHTDALIAAAFATTKVADSKLAETKKVNDADAVSSTRKTVTADNVKDAGREHIASLQKREKQRN